MRSLLVRAFLTVIFVSILVGIIAYARGYRYSFTDNDFVSTGILAASSSPEGAKVLVNGKLKGATDTNISLSPGHYEVEIKKDGYTTWKDTVTVKGEVVTQVYALLFPQNPSLSPLTTLGVVKVVNFPQVNKVIIFSEDENRATQSAQTDDELEKNGIYVLENSPRPLSIFNPLKLLITKSQIPGDFKLENCDLKMAPDGKQMILVVKNANGAILANYLLSTEDKTDTPFDITQSIATIEQAWSQKQKKTTDRILQTFKKDFFDWAINSLEPIAFAPDNTKVFYRAKRTTTIPIIIKPRLIGTKQTLETRELKAGSLYVYDKKEDKNYLITDISIPTIRRGKPSPVNPRTVETNYHWFPDSIHLVFKNGQEIAVMDYDGTHEQVVYSGPFQEDFLAVSAEGKLLILANLNPQTNQLPDVYAVGIR